MLFLQAKELPRGALVECQLNWNTGRAPESSLEDQDDESDGRARTPVTLRGKQPSFSWSLCCDASGRPLRGFIEIHGEADENSLCLKTGRCPADLVAAGQLQLETVVSIRVYHTVPARKLSADVGISDDGEDLARKLIRNLFGSYTTCISWIPVLSITSQTGLDIPAALEIFGA